MSKSKIQKERHLVQVSEEELLEKQRLLQEKIRTRKVKKQVKPTFVTTSSLVWECSVDNPSFKKSALSSTIKEYKKRRKIERKKPVKSKGEDFLNKELKRLDFTFQREFIFEDCFNPKTGKPLRFDFYIPSLKVAIEYDGVQHKKHCPQYNITIEQFNSQVERDKIKTNFCIKNDIHLIRFSRIDKKKIRKVLEKLKAPPAL